MLFLTQEIGQRLLERLTFIKMNPLILLNLGDPTETFPSLLQLKYPTATILNHDNNVTFTHLKTQSVDCIFSNCLLPWNIDLSSFFQKIKRILKPEGVFLFSSFGPDTLKELRESLEKTNPHTPENPFIDMHDIGDELIKLSFLDPVLDLEYIKVEYQHVQDLLNDLLNSPIHSFLPPAQSIQVPQLSKQYEIFKEPSGILPATFEIIYGLAWNSQDIHNNLHPMPHRQIPIKVI